MSGPTYIADAHGPDRVELEGLTLLFHAASGMTHILAPPAPQILELLAHAPADVAALLERLALHYEFDVAEGRAAVAARLAELETAGLVQRA